MTLKELRIKRRGRIRRELSRQQSLDRYRRINGQRMLRCNQEAANVEPQAR